MLDVKCWKNIIIIFVLLVGWEAMVREFTTRQRRVLFLHLFDYSEGNLILPSDSAKPLRI